METATLTPAGTSAAAASAPSAARRTGMAGLRSEDFFRILVTELQSQDPLAPSDTGEMIAQVSQIRSIEQANALNETLEKLAEHKPLGESSALIGKFITARLTDANGNPSQLTGLVTGVRFEADGTVMLELDNGQSVRLADVVAVSSVDPEEAALGLPTAGDGAPPMPAATEPAKDGAAKAAWPFPSLRELLGV